jgi:mono/diheme cytochrome c family protein
MYSNGIRKTEIPELQKKNFYNATKWHTADNTDIAHGKTIFKYQCMSCHTENGYRSMKKLIGERDKEAVVGFLNLMKETDPEKNPYSGLMPPFVGDREDMDKLAAYLTSLNGSSSESQKTGKLEAKKKIAAGGGL